MQMPGRNFSSASGYRFGFNGKEKDNEIKGDGNSLDFGARIYDSRLGRWASIDPRQNEAPDESTYSSFGNNSVRNVDEDGEFWNVVAGALIGAAVDYGAQVTSNYLEGKENPFTDNISVSSIVASTIEGGLTSGASAIRNVTTKVVVKTAIKVTTTVAKNTIDVKVKDGQVSTKIEKNIGNVAKNTLVDITVDAAVGGLLPKEKSVQKTLSHIGVNKGTIATNTKKVVESTGKDITRKTNNLIKNGSELTVKAVTKTTLRTSEIAIKGSTQETINTLKVKTDK
jgi:RHS repeat-associated protein